MDRLLTAALVLLTSMAAPIARQTPPQDPEWMAIYDFSLEVDGKPSPDARFFVEREGPRLLIQVPGAAKAALVIRDTREVAAVDAAKVKIEGDGDAARLAPKADAGLVKSPYTIDAASVVFYLGAQRFKITPKQPLVGPATVDQILTHSPIYKKGLEQYTPSMKEVSFLHSFGQPIEIEVFFGTWCQHCKTLVPKFMRAMRDANNSANLKVYYNGVPKGFSSYEPAQAKSVKGIPTFIFYRGGKEFGRIPGEPANNETIEQAVCGILKTVGK
ncbi:MAG TPA: thioredoxin family protein [Candidatus Polarisedimenticolia bacterium]|nr:thioredoxin family protein [Candidatus Polarisedimenticolia bacterium]